MGTSATEKVVNNLNVSKLMLCNLKMLTPEMCVRIGQAINGAIDLLREQQQIINSLKSDLQETLEVVSGQLNVVRCKDCRKNMMCEMTIHKPKDWFCADGERKDDDA